MVAETSGSNVSLVNLSNKLQEDVNVQTSFKIILEDNCILQHTQKTIILYLDFPVPLSPIIRSFKFTVSMSSIAVGMTPTVNNKNCTRQHV